MSKSLVRHCPNRRVLGILGKEGTFAEYITLPIANLHAVPDNLSNEELVFVEPLAAACEILEQVHIEPSHCVAVIGDGKLGQLIAQVLMLTGCRIELIGKHAEKMNIAKSLGIRVVEMNSIIQNAYDVVVEASGSPSGFELALKLVRPRGIFVLKSTTHKLIPLHSARIVIDEIQLIGSRCGPFKPALRLLEKQQIKVQPLISKVFSLDQEKSDLFSSGRVFLKKIFIKIKKYIRKII